ncbi:MAG: dockerin type I domain-containing protein [Clostridia bacterium]|nr:dockerin type I domain-containing protein [Clostridia bacterium]
MKKFLSIILTVLIIVSTCFCMSVGALSVVATGKTISETKMYSNAGTVGHQLKGEKTEIIATIPANTKVDIYSSKDDADGDRWYYVKTSNGKVGYIVGTKILRDSTRLFDADFDKNLKNFPKEYQASLKALHKEFPNWRFYAEPTGSTFEEALDAEYRPKEKTPLKLVELTYMGEEWRDERAKIVTKDAKGNEIVSWANGEGVKVDGKVRWTYASRYAISYFMNPTNFLNSKDIFMFLTLSYNEKTQTKDIVKSVVKNTFLDTPEYIDIIMKAAKESGLSPIAIASLIIIEQGTSGSSQMISGTVENYKGYYNFFNIGASDSNPIINGLKEAKKKGWNSKEKAIIGGAKDCQNGYISVGQDTYYYMDYNVVIKNYSKQYATAIYDAYNKGRKMAAGCTANKSSTLDFVIPVFSSEIPEISKPTPAPKVIKYGDVNKDNSIDIIDAAMIRKHILKISKLTVSKNPEADINKDGTIDVIDAAKMRKHLLKIEIIGGNK